MKGHMEDDGFHPHTKYKKGTRKSRDQTAKTEGVKIRKKKNVGVRFSRTKMMYIYDSYDGFIEALERAENMDDVGKVIEMIREERDDLPSTKSVVREFAYNHNDDPKFLQFANFIESHPEIDEGEDDYYVNPKEYSGFD